MDITVFADSLALAPLKRFEHLELHIYIYMYIFELRS